MIIPNGYHHVEEYKRLYLDIENRGLERRHPDLAPSVRRHLRRFKSRPNERLASTGLSARAFGGWVARRGPVGPQS
jgi:hypothetical protein